MKCKINYGYNQFTSGTFNSNNSTAHTGYAEKISLIESSALQNAEIYKMFDKNVSTFGGWVKGPNTKLVYWNSYPVAIQKIYFTNFAGDAYGTRAPLDVYVLTSIDGINWAVLETFQNSVSAGGASWSVELTNPIYSNYYAFQVVNTSYLNAAAANQILLAEIELEGTIKVKEIHPIRYTTQGGVTTIEMSNSNYTPPTPTPSETTVTNLSSNYDFGHIYCNGFETGNDYLATTNTGWTYAVSELSTSVTRILVWTFDNPIQLTYWAYDTSTTSSNWTITPYAYLNNQVVDLTGMSSSNPKTVDSILLSYDVSAATPNMPIGCKNMTIKYLTGGN